MPALFKKIGGQLYKINAQLNSKTSFVIKANNLVSYTFNSQYFGEDDEKE